MVRQLMTVRARSVLEQRECQREACGEALVDPPPHRPCWRALVVIGFDGPTAAGRLPCSPETAFPPLNNSSGRVLVPRV